MVDIIIPTYNRASHLQLTLESLVRQSIGTTMMKVIVVDDGSNDETFDVVKSFIDNLQLVYFYQPDRGYRVVSARNNGFRLGTSELCVFIDSGILLASNCIEQHIRFHDSHQEPIALIGYVHGFDTNDDDFSELRGIISQIKKVDEIIEYLECHEKFLDVREGEFRTYNHQIDTLPAPWAYFWTGHISINRNSIDNSDIFDSAFEPRYGYEDVDLGYRLHKRNINIFLNPHAKALHYPHRKRDSYMEDKKRNAHLFGSKHDSYDARMLVENGGTKGLNELLLRRTVHYSGDLRSS